jgi:hypothetical protein
MCLGGVKNVNGTFKTWLHFKGELAKAFTLK